MNLAEAAAACAARNWAVFPLRPGSKLPATAHGFKDATSDAERVARWWAKHPDHNIGVATGGTFDVLDIDDPLAGAALHDLWRAAGGPGGFLSCEGAHGPAVRTPRGGLHLYVAATGLGNRAGFVPGADWRGRGGYVVAPPSTDHRGGWEWVDGYGPDTPLPALPYWLAEVLDPTTTTRPVLRVLPGGRRDTDAYARRALEAEVGRVALAPVGQRNDQLNRSAFSLGQLVAGGVLDIEEVAGALYNAGVRAGLPGREVENTVRSGLSRGVQLPRTAP